MPDDDEIRRVAAEYIRARGSHAVAWLLEQAELAEGIGDFNAARTWREIAAAAKSAMANMRGRHRGAGLSGADRGIVLGPSRTSLVGRKHRTAVERTKDQPL